MTEDVELSPVFLADFVRALAILALPADDQISWIHTLGVEVGNVDELALAFDDGYQLLPQFIDRRWLPEGIQTAADEIDRLFARMSGSEGPWSFDELRGDSRWIEVRSLAIHALSEIDGGAFVQ